MRRPLVLAAVLFSVTVGSVLIVTVGPVAALRPSASAAPEAGATTHPHFDDKGTLTWTSRLADAQKAAKAEGKLILVEYGREACSNCKAFVERTLTDTTIAERAAPMFVGLFSECDKPSDDPEVGKILRENLSGASTLPFVGVLTPDLKWVTGFAGYRDVAKFTADLDAVEKSGALSASPAVAKKLEALLATAQKAVEKEQWPKVLTCADDAKALTGRHVARDGIEALAAKARAVVEAALTTALGKLASGGDAVAEARKELYQLGKAYRGQPEGDDADRGMKAADKLSRLSGLEGEPLEKARARAAEEFAGTRWAALFGG